MISKREVITAINKQNLNSSMFHTKRIAKFHSAVSTAAALLTHSFVCWQIGGITKRTENIICVPYSLERLYGRSIKTLIHSSFMIEVTIKSYLETVLGTTTLGSYVWFDVGVNESAEFAQLHLLVQLRSIKDVAVL